MNHITVVIGSSAREGGQRALSRSDRAAVHLAVCRFHAPVTALTDASDEFAVRYALAAGVRRVESLSFEVGARFDVILVGHGFIEKHGDLFAAQIAVSRDAALVFDVIDIEPVAGERLRVICDAGKGARDVFSVAPPAVFVMSAAVRKPPYVSQYRLSRVVLPNRERPASVLTSVSEHNWQPARPRVKSTQKSFVLADAADRMAGAFGITSAATTDKGENLIDADAKTCAQHLLRYLRHHGFIATGGGADQPMQPAARSAKPADAASVESRATTTIRRPMPVEIKISRRWDRWPRRVTATAQLVTTISRTPQKLNADGRPTSPAPHQRRPRRIDELLHQ